MLTKITITNENRSVVIPVEYDAQNDQLEIKEIQIDPIPNESEDVSKDVVMAITTLIMNLFNSLVPIDDTK